MHVRVANEFVGIVEILLGERRTGKINTASKNCSPSSNIVPNASFLLDDIVVVAGIEVRPKQAVVHIHLVEYLSDTRVVVDLQSVDRKTVYKQQQQQAIKITFMLNQWRSE